MKVLIAFLVGGLVGYGAHWYLGQPRYRPGVVHARENAGGVGGQNAFDLDAIKDELSRTGRVIREKAIEAGAAISDAAANGRITATIKAKLARESASSLLAIDVDTTDGVVTLSGKVSSYDQIARAMKLAMETDGVHKVISTLQLKNPAPETPQSPR